MMSIDSMTIEECLSIKRDVEEYLRSKQNKEQITSYDLLSDHDKLLVLMYAKLLSKKAEEMEPGITKDLKDLELDGIGKLVSLEHRKKTITSIIEKIIADSKSERYKGSYKRAADNICDTVRYTFIIPDDIYTEKLDECLHMLEDMGYEVIDFKNKWGELAYKGVNVRISTKDHKEIFELQFHTPLGYRIKEGVSYGDTTKVDETPFKIGSTRSLYQVSRDDDAPEWLRIRADRLRSYLQTFIDTPKGILDYMYDRDIKRR